MFPTCGHPALFDPLAPAVAFRISAALPVLPWVVDSVAPSGQPLPVAHASAWMLADAPFQVARGQFRVVKAPPAVRERHPLLLVFPFPSARYLPARPWAPVELVDPECCGPVRQNQT